MKLRELDGKTVRITTKWDEVFEGECEYQVREFCECEIGVDEDALSIDSWYFYRSQIRDVSVIEEKENYIWMNRTSHRMTLDEKLYYLADYGKKTVEVRLYDEKRQRIKAGDVIRFENRRDETDVLYVLVKEVSVFPSFSELFAAVSPEACGILDEDPVSFMGQYYPPEEQQKYQAAAIRFESMPED